MSVFWCCRDWGSSDATIAVRDNIYKRGILAAIKKHFSGIWQELNILIPGAAMGRLAVEIASLGGNVEVTVLITIYIALFRFTLLFAITFFFFRVHYMT